MIYSSSLNKNTEKDLTNEFSLGDLCEVVTKGTTPTSVGHKLIEGGINFIKIECNHYFINGINRHTSQR